MVSSTNVRKSALLLFVSTSLFAIDAQPNSSKPGDRKEIVLAIGLLVRDLWISSNDDLVKEADIVYISNTPGMASIAASYGDFGGAAKFNLAGSRRDSKEFGKSEAVDFQLNYYAERIGFDVFYQDYRGFYADYKTVPADNSTNAKIREDLKSLYWGANFYVSFPSSFMLRSAFRWPGYKPGFQFGFILGTSASVLSINSSRSFLTRTQEIQIPDYAGYVRGDYANFSVMPGFAITAAGPTGFFGSLMFAYGGGISNASLSLNSGNSQKITDNHKVNLKFVLGYEFDGVLIFGTVFFDYTAPGAFTRSTFIVSAFSAAAELGVGYRF